MSEYDSYDTTVIEDFDDWFTRVTNSLTISQ